MQKLQLQAFIRQDSKLNELMKRVEPKLKHDPVHDLAHALRVASMTISFAPSVDPRQCVAAALLHDVVNHPKNSALRSQSSVDSANLARDILPHFDFEPKAVETIADAIEDHSFSRGQTPRSDLGRGLQDADRLEALGAIGIFRTIAYGAKMGAAFFDSEDPFSANRQLDDARFTVDHFFTKLLRLADTMQTDAGKAEAHKRSEAMRAFLSQLGCELDITPPF